jgi:uncharacterized protein YndB with AHSA1/START domain
MQQSNTEVTTSVLEFPMTNSSTPTQHASFVLERTYPHPPSRVFRLLSTLEGKQRWFLDGREAEIKSYELDFSVGGFERARYTYHNGSPIDGLPFLNEGVYLDIEPDRRIAIASFMSLGGRRISVTLATFELMPTPDGTKLTFIHQGVFFPPTDGPKMREQGWVTLLGRLSAALDGGAST